MRKGCFIKLDNDGIPPLDFRFIDTAYDLEKEGVSDPAGSSHLAELLGHLFDMKMVGYTLGVYGNNEFNSHLMPDQQSR